jgi:hypothetical protein
MKTASLMGIILVQVALACYSIAIISEQRKRKITNRVLAFLPTGALLVAFRA